MKNLVLCADGTCNAFGHSSSNVAKLVEYVEIHDERAQFVCYDQGVGTRLSQFEKVREFAERLGPAGALRPLAPPRDAWTRLWTWPSLVLSMTHGVGLEANVGQLYEALAELYSTGDRVFLFGFSRGAFEVRALAGLIWRYGIPAKDQLAFANSRFEEAWDLFKHEYPDEGGANAQKARDFMKDHCQRACPIHFLGLWDTVKSYGGLRPVRLPHLRHNPSVATVRHALALDERRAWFEVTTWGWLDSDQKKDAAASRLTQCEIDAIRNQDVLEVWFRGSHSDVGGGGRNDFSSMISLRWMLSEAQKAGLKLNSAGRCLVSMPREDEFPEIEDSRTMIWRIIEQIPRRAIKNAGRWPTDFRAKRGASPRRPQDSVRDGRILYHESVVPHPGQVYPTLRTRVEE